MNRFHYFNPKLSTLLSLKKLDIMKRNTYSLTNQFWVLSLVFISFVILSKSLKFVRAFFFNFIRYYKTLYTCVVIKAHKCVNTQAVCFRNNGMLKKKRKNGMLLWRSKASEEWQKWIFLDLDMRIVQNKLNAMLLSTRTPMPSLSVN